MGYAGGVRLLDLTCTDETAEPESGMVAVVAPSHGLVSLLTRQREGTSDPDTLYECLSGAHATHLFLTREQATQLAAALTRASELLTHV